MTTIKPLAEQLSDVAARMILEASRGQRVVRVELPSDLYSFMCTTLKKGMTIPEGIFENSMLKPGDTYLVLERLEELVLN